MTIGLLVAAAICTFLAFLRMSGAWEGGLETEALIRLLFTNGTIWFVAYRLFEPYLWEAFNERAKRMVDEMGEELDMPPDVKPANLRGYAEDYKALTLDSASIDVAGHSSKAEATEADAAST